MALTDKTLKNKNMPKPLVLVSACAEQLNGQPIHMVGRKFTEAVRLAGALPLVAPWLEPDELDAVLDTVHGVLLTGSPSNIHPSNYGAAVQDPDQPLDCERDAWTLPLVRRAVARGVPVLGICRGAQEINVALGGSLHQAVQTVPGLLDHRDDPDAELAEQYAAAHTVQVQAGGLLDKLLGAGRTLDVNSLHGQGVDRLAPGLHVEAVAPDGLVEAFSVPQAQGFCLSVQWHPEWMAAENPVSMRVLTAFGDAVRARQVQQASSVGQPQPQPQPQPQADGIGGIDDRQHVQDRGLAEAA